MTCSVWEYLGYIFVNVSVIATLFMCFYSRTCSHIHICCVWLCTCVYVDTFCSRVDRLNSPKNTLQSPDPPSHTCKTHTYTLVLSSMNSPSSNTCLHPQVGAVWSLRLLCSVQLLCPKTKGSGPEEWKQISIKFTREAVKRQ